MASFPATSTLQTLIGVTPSMRFFGVGWSRVRSVASRSRPDVTREDPRLDVRKIHIRAPTQEQAWIASKIQNTHFDGLCVTNIGATQQATASGRHITCVEHIVHVASAATPLFVTVVCTAFHKCNNDCMHPQSSASV